MDEVVFVADVKAAPLQWISARAPFVYIGSDNIVRVVTIRTTTIENHRSTHNVKSDL